VDRIPCMQKTKETTRRKSVKSVIGRYCDTGVRHGYDICKRQRPSGTNPWQSSFADESIKIIPRKAAGMNIGKTEMSKHSDCNISHKPIVKFCRNRETEIEGLGEHV
jgi:hypothetical protein